ncbi:hypothetical protein [Gardnerella vaginalis]|uniref:hypothetical protein n=1 Tax=Gardnerella vaginalis TaxID=2702 RepID=UPI00336ABA4E
MTAPESNTFLKCVRAIRDFVARRIDSSVARESKKASCVALRSNASKNAFIKSSQKASRKACGSCTSRALLSLLVASATLLATFVIAPTSALSAGENAGGSAGANTVSNEKAEGVKSDSAKTEGEKQQPEQNESSNTEPNKKNTDTSSTLNKDNKESNPVEKQQNANSNGVDKAKSDAPAVNKKVKDAQKKGASAKASSKMERSATADAEPPKECKDAGITELAKCYVAEYKVKSGKKYVSYVTINEAGGSYTANPVFHRVTKLNNKSGNPSELTEVSYDEVKSFVKSFSLEGIVVDKKLLDLKEETNNFVKVDSVSGVITIRPNKWLKNGTYCIYVKVDYKDKSSLTHPESIKNSKGRGYEKYSQFTVKIKYKNSTNNVLSLKVYNHQEADGRTEVDETNGVTFTLNKDGKFSPFTPIFIDSQSSEKFNPIYHRMICHKDGDSNYYLDSINGLTLSDSADASVSAKPPTQKQWKPSLGNRTDGSVLNDFTSGKLYENDGIGERSQSWITTGTPNVGSEGKYTCKVFAFKDAKLKQTLDGGKNTKYSKLVTEFDARAATTEGKQSLFKGNIVEDKWKKDSPITQGVDWDYKSVTIEVKSSNPPKPKPPTIGDNDLTLKVYPFKNGDDSLPTELPDKNNKISAILGMELKPFIDATSAADSANKIMLRVLCSKGEKKNNNAAVSVGASNGGTGSSGSGSARSGSNVANTGTGSQAEEPLEYKTWSSNLAELGLSVPEDDDQNTCHSNKEGETTCVSADKTKVAARTDKEVTLKPTAVGDYQCVVYALKQNALTVQSGKQTPADIDKALADDKSLKENKDFATFKLNIDSVSKFTLPDTGGHSWNLQLGILAALLVNLLAAGFVVSQSERGRKLILGRWRGLCNHV